MYRVLLRPQARKDLDRLSDSLYLRIAATIDGLAAEPRPASAEKLAGHPRTWRLRVGDYRVLYEALDNEEKLVILRVRHRRQGPR